MIVHNSNIYKKKYCDAMISKLSIIFVTLLILCSAQGVFAQEEVEWQEYETEHFIIKYHDLDDSTLSMVAIEAENAYDKVTSDLRYRPDNKTVIRIGIAKEDHDWTKGNAFYLRDLNTIDLLSPSQKRWMNYESYIRKSIPHEFTHHIINVGYKFTFPDWLNEGTASFEAGESPNYKKFKRALAKNELHSLNEMWIFDLLEDDERRLAYVESYTIIEYIIDTYGHDGLIDILTAHKETLDTDQVIHDAFGVSTKDFELGWMNFVKDKYGSSSNNTVHPIYYIIILFAVSAIVIRMKYRNK